LNYASLRWVAGSVLSGGRNGTISLSPQYSSTGWFWQMKRAKLTQDTYLTPTSNAFVELYRSRSLYRQEKEGQLRYLSESQPPNGLIVPFGGEDRLVYFTSGRVLQYRIGRLSASQLIADKTFFGRSDVAGRSYGLVGFDPQSRDRIAVIAGTHAGTVAEDMVSGKMASDPWGAIERHVTVYELASNRVTQKFYGSAHDNKDDGRYQNRIVHPAHMFVPVANGPSRLAFNRFADGAWNFHVTKQGSPSDSFRISGLFVWDVRDIDGDGEVEIIASPTPRAARNLRGYFPEWKTQIYSYDRNGGWLRLRQEFSGVIPWFTAAPIEPETTSSAGTLFPVLTGWEKQTLGFYVRTRAGAAQFAAIDTTSNCSGNVRSALARQDETFRPPPNAKRTRRGNSASQARRNDR
jgi:hypothetical protein